MTSWPDTPFTSASLPAIGATRKQLAAGVREGRLRRVLRDVYVRHDVPDTVEVRAAAASLVVAPGAVFVDRTAAWLHGIDVLDYRELEVLPPLECVVLRDCSRIERPECRGGERDLLRSDITVVYGLRVTTRLRTALDLGCLLPRPDGLAALDMFLRAGVTKGELEHSLPRYRRRRGVVKLRELVTLSDPRAESPRESRTRLAMHDDGLPPPRLQHWIEEHVVPVFRLDHGYPRHRIAVEYDGYDWHDRTEKQRAADRARRRWLSDHGWTVVVVRKGDFAPDTRGRWLGEVRAALSARERS